MTKSKTVKQVVAYVTIICFTFGQMTPASFADMNPLAEEGALGQKSAVDPNDVVVETNADSDSNDHSHDGFFDPSPLSPADSSKDGEVKSQEDTSEIVVVEPDTQVSTREEADRVVEQKQMIHEEFYEGDVLKKKEDIQVNGQTFGAQNVNLLSSRMFNVHGETVYAQVDIRDDNEDLLLSEFLIQTTYGFEGEGKDRQLKSIRGMVSDGRWLTIKLEGDTIDITYDRAPTIFRQVVTRVTDERITSETGSRYTKHHHEKVTVEIFEDKSGRIIDALGNMTYYSDMAIVTADLQKLDDVDDDWMYVNGQYVPDAHSLYGITQSELIFVEDLKAGSVTTGWDSGVQSYDGSPAVFGNWIQGPPAFTPVLKSAIDNSMTTLFEMDFDNHGKFVIESYETMGRGTVIGKILLPENAAGDLRVVKMFFIEDYSQCVGGSDGLPGVCSGVKLVNEGSLSMRETEEGYSLYHSFLDSIGIGHAQTFLVNEFEPHIEDMDMTHESIYKNTRAVYRGNGLFVGNTLDINGSVSSTTILLTDATYVVPGGKKLEFNITLTNVNIQYSQGDKPKIIALTGTTDDGRPISIRLIGDSYVIDLIENKFVPISEASGLYIGEDVIETVEQMMAPSFEIEGINLAPALDGARLILNNVLLSLKAVQAGTSYLHAKLWHYEPYEVYLDPYRKELVWKDFNHVPYQGKDYIRPITVGDDVDSFKGQGLSWSAAASLYSDKPLIDEPFFGVGETKYVVLGNSLLLDLKSVNRFSDAERRTNQSWDFELVPEGQMDELTARVSRQARIWNNQTEPTPGNHDTPIDTNNLSDTLPIDAFAAQGTGTGEVTVYGKVPSFNRTEQSLMLRIVDVVDGSYDTDYVNIDDLVNASGSFQKKIPMALANTYIATLVLVDKSTLVNGMVTRNTVIVDQRNSVFGIEIPGSVEESVESDTETSSPDADINPLGEGEIDLEDPSLDPSLIDAATDEELGNTELFEGPALVETSTDEMSGNTELDFDPADALTDIDPEMLVDEGEIVVVEPDTLAMEKNLDAVLMDLSSSVETDPATLPVPMINDFHYLISGTKVGADLSLDFDSLDKARAFVDGTLAANNVKATFAEIGIAFEVDGTAVVVSYEKTDTGVTLYLKNDVNSVNGKSIAVIDWQAFGNDPVPQDPQPTSPVTIESLSAGQQQEGVVFSGKVLNFDPASKQRVYLKTFSEDEITFAEDFGIDITDKIQADGSFNLDPVSGLNIGSHQAVLRVVSWEGFPNPTPVIHTSKQIDFGVNGWDSVPLDPSDEVKRNLEDADALFLRLAKADSYTLQDTIEIRAIQAKLKLSIEALPEDQRAEWVKKFNDYLNQSDAFIAPRSLKIILDDGREILVRNPTDLMTGIIRRFKMMDQTGEIDLSRLAGIDPEDLKNESFPDYLASRKIGAALDIPLFDLFSAYGNIELIDRLVRKYAAGDMTRVEGPWEVVQEDFLRYVDGTKPVFDAAVVAARKILASHSIQMPADPLTVKSLQTVLEQVAQLNQDLSQELKAQIEQFRGEAVFKDLVTSQITNAVMWNQDMNPSYGQIWQNLTNTLNNRGIVYTIGGKEVRVSRAELDAFTNGLPYDSGNLFRYPGVKADINASFLSELISQEYYNRLGSLTLQNLPGVSLFADPSAGNVYFSYPAKRFQLLEQFLKTWVEVITPNGTVNFDRLRFRLLISYELEIALGRAEEFLNGKVKEMEAFAKKTNFSKDDYAAMKAILQLTQEELATRFNPLLKDVIYDTTNEVTSRIQQRYQLLVNSFTTVLANVKVSVSLSDGTVLSVNPRSINAEALEVVLNATAIRSNGRFTRGAYERLNGIDAEALANLLSPEKINQLKYFSFYNYQSSWQSQNVADEEILFNLIPEIVQKAGTADPEALIAYLSEGIKLPVPIGQGLEAGIRAGIQSLSQTALNAMRGQPLNSIEDLGMLREIFKKYHTDLSAQLEVFRDFLSPEDRSRVENMVTNPYAWAYGNANPNLGTVLNEFNARVNGIQFLEVKGTRVPVSLILQIPGLPWSKDFDDQLFAGLVPADIASAETQSEAQAYQSFSFNAVNQGIGFSLYLSALGRVEFVATVIQRLIDSGMDTGKIFFANSAGRNEVDPEAFRKHIKGVVAMQQALIKETEEMTRDAAKKMEQMRKGVYTIEEVDALHQQVLEIRAKLINLLNEKVTKHERRDVIEVENAVSLIYQKTVFDLFVSIVGAAQLEVEIDGQTVTVPAKAITDALIDHLKTQVEGSIAAHHFATLYGISVDDVRRAHKLENYLGEQMVVMPRNSEYVQIVSQLSELGYMQLAAMLVKRYAKEVIRDGVVDVALLMDRLANKDRAVAQIKQEARDVLAVKIAELRKAAGRKISMEALNQIVSLMEDAKGLWVSMMNDFLSGNSDDEMLKELESFVNALNGELKSIRDEILENTPFVYEVDGKEISLFLNKEMVAKFVRAIGDWLAANPGFKPMSFAPEYMYGLDIVPSGMISLQSDTLVAGGMISMEAVAVRAADSYQIKIWQPYPNPSNYNPGDHPTEFGLAVLLARLAVKYAEFAVDENGFNWDLFRKELQRTDAERAVDRLQSLLDLQLPQLKKYIDSLRDRDGALPVSKIGEINGKFQTLKEIIRILGDDAQNKAQSVWGSFMNLYENALFEGRLSAQVNGQRVTFEPKVLNDLLMTLHQQGKLDPELMKKFNTMIQQGETTWQYNSFKELSYYRSWFDYGYGYDPVPLSFGALPDETMDSLEAEGRVTLGDLARFPGISGKDLNGLPVSKKENHLRLSPVDPLKLLGLLDMRSLAPGSSASVGGLMMTADTGLRASSAMMVQGIGVDEMVVWSPRIKETPDLGWKSFRFVAFELIPVMLQEIIGALGEESLLRDDQISEVAFGEILENYTQRAAEAKARKRVFEDLVKTFGLAKGMLKEFMAKGLVEIEIDLVNSKATVSIDPSVKLPEGAVNLADPLGTGKLPETINYELNAIIPVAMGAPCSISLDGSIGNCPQQDLSPTYFLQSGEFKTSEGYTVQLSYVEVNGGISTVGSNRVYSVSVVEIDDPCNGNPQCLSPVSIKLIRDIVFSYGAENSNGRFLNGDGNINAHIDYHDGSQGPIASRDIKIMRDADNQYHIQNVTDFDKDGRVIAVNQFGYDVAFTNCAERVLGGSSCPLPRVVLVSIVRTDSEGQGNLVSKITGITMLMDSSTNLELGSAMQTFPDESGVKLFFSTLEELLNQALNNELLRNLVNALSEKAEAKYKEAKALAMNPDANQDGVMDANDLKLLEDDRETAAVLAGDLKQIAAALEKLLDQNSDLVKPVLAVVNERIEGVGQILAMIDESMAAVKAAIDLRNQVAGLSEKAEGKYREANALETKADANDDGVMDANDLKLLEDDRETAAVLAGDLKQIAVELEKLLDQNSEFVKPVLDLVNQRIDGVGQIIGVIDASILAIRTPTANAQALAMNEDTSRSIQLTAKNGVGGGTLTFAILSPPANGTLTIDSVTGRGIYKPNANFNGTDTFAFVVDNGFAKSEGAAVNITINAVNDAPMASAMTFTANEDGELADKVTGSDVDGDSLSFALVRKPLHGTITFNGDGTFVYKPIENYNGPDSFTFRANDGKLNSAAGTISLKIAAVNDAPATTPLQMRTLNEDVRVTITPTGIDIDKDPLTFILVDGPEHGTVTINEEGKFVYTPEANYNGTDRFTFKANDGQLDSADVGAIMLNIAAINDAPAVEAMTFGGEEDGEIRDKVSGSDVDGGDALTFSLVRRPAHGIVTFNPDGSFVYTPNTNYNGADSFTFRANDGKLNSPVGTVSLSLAPANDAPVFSPISPKTVKAGRLLKVPVKVKDPDQDAEDLALTLVVRDSNGDVIATPSWMTMNWDPSTKQFVFSAKSPNKGLYTLTIKATDLSGIEAETFFEFEAL